MSRTNLQQRILDMTLSDFRILRLSAEAANVWIRLMAVILRHGMDGVLTLGNDKQPSFEQLAAIGLQISETQLKTWLETYAKTQLITYDETSGTISFPEELTRSRRATASRLNGKKGGRPRKNVEAQAELHRRQPSLMMPIQGGVATEKENLTETQKEKRSDKLSLSLEEDKKAKATTESFDAIATTAQEAAGLVPSPSQYGIIRKWYERATEAGLNPTDIERLITETVSSITDRQIRAGNAPRHMGYFNSAVNEAINDYAATLPTPQAKAERLYVEALEHYSAEIGQGNYTQRKPRLEDFLSVEVAA